MNKDEQKRLDKRRVIQEIVDQENCPDEASRKIEARGYKPKKVRVRHPGGVIRAIMDDDSVFESTKPFFAIERRRKRRES